MATSGQGVLRRLLAVFTFEVDQKGLDKGKEKLRDWVGDMKKVATAFAGGAIAKGIGNFVKDTLDEMTQIRKGAAELRITTDEMQALRSAGRALGMDIKWLHFSMERLQVSTELAARGSARQAASMQLLGLKTHDAAGKQKSATELFLDTADGISKMTDTNKQAIAVWDLFGRGGHRLLPMLRMGRQRIEELMNATKEYGRYTPEVIEQGAQYTLVLEHMRLVWTGIKNFIMSQWLPILQKQTEGLIKVGKWMLNMSKNSQAAKAALQLLQVAMAGLAIKMALAYPYATLLLGALVAIWHIWDDILVLFDGGHSLIGDVLDALFGKGSSTAVVKELRDLYKDLAASVEAIMVALHLKKPQTSETDRVDAIGGGAAAPTVGATDVSVKQNPIARMLGGAPEIVQTPGGVQVNRSIWDRLMDPNGMDVKFGSTPVLDTQSRPDDTPNFTYGDVNVNVTAPPGADAMTLGDVVGHAVRVELNNHTKAAAANLRREKH